MGLYQIWLLALGLIIAMAEPVSAAPKKLTVLHTGDIHGHIESWTGWEGELSGKQIGGFDRLATAIKQARDAAGREQVLLLDSGDAFSDTLLANLTEGGAVISLMNRLSYDAMALGNHEFDFGIEKLSERARQATFPLLAANVRHKKTGQPITKPYVVKQVGSIRVGILGLGYPNTPLTTAKKNVEEVVFDQAVETARRFLPELRNKGAELIIVLSHLGLAGERTLAENVPGIDVIVGGHSHNRMKEALAVGQTLIVQAGAHGSDLGRLDLEIENGRVVSHTRQLILLDHQQVASDQSIAKEIAVLKEPFRAQLTAHIGQLDGTLARAQTLAGQEARKRKAESAADDLFADILRETTASDVALLPGVGYGVAIPAGPVTEGALRNLIPHRAKAVTMTLTGHQIRSILERAVENTFSSDSKEKVGGMIQVSGLKFSYLPNKLFGERVTSLTIGPHPIDSTKRYKVATNAMLADGGHHYEVFLKGQDRKEGDEVYLLVKRWFERRGQVHPPASGRIVEQIHER